MITINTVIVVFTVILMGIAVAVIVSHLVSFFTFVRTLSSTLRPNKSP